MASSAWFEYRVLRWIYRTPGSQQGDIDWSGLMAARRRLMRADMVRRYPSSPPRYLLTDAGMARYEELQHDLDVWGSL